MVPPLSLNLSLSSAASLLACCHLAGDWRFDNSLSPSFPSPSLLLLLRRALSMFLSLKMSPFSLFFLLSFSILFLSPPSYSSSISIYDLLRSHGLPMGLLPKGIANFTVDDEGRFEVLLDHPCDAKLESQFHYDRNVSGVLTYGQIASLSGVSAQELFLWFPVKTIRVDIPSSGLIYFDVGVIYKQFPISIFETPPDCELVDDSESQMVELQHDEDEEDLRAIS